MKALSIRQPWTWAILEAGKDIENRDWFSSFKGRIALHAAKGMTKGEYQGACQFIRDRAENWPLIGDLSFGAILGVVDIVGCVKQSPSPWFEGKYGFVLANPKRLPEPIPCRGALGFWDVPVEIERQIKEMLL